MKKQRMYKNWNIEIGAGNAARLPQGYHCYVYADIANKIIYTGKALSQGWDERDAADKRIATICHPHPYYGHPDHITRDELISLAESDRPYCTRYSC